jgi:hypothetical protein
MNAEIAGNVGRAFNAHSDNFAVYLGRCVRLLALVAAPGDHGALGVPGVTNGY